MDTRHRAHTVEELLAIGKNKSWETNPGWSESLKYRRFELEKKRKREYIILAVAIIVFCGALLGAFLSFGNQQMPLYPALSGILFGISATYALGIRTALKTIGEIDETREQLLRVGVDQNVLASQRGRSKS